MDLSKLPRLSETDRHAPPPVEENAALRAQPVQRPDPAASGGLGAQVWFSAILGLVFMMIGWNFARFCIAKLAGQSFHTNVTWQTGAQAGKEVAYFELQGYTAYTETGIFLFGLAMVLEAIMLATVRRNTPLARTFVAFAVLVTAGMTLFNLIVVAMLFKIGLMPIWSILVVAFGGYMTMFEWQALKQMLAQRRAGQYGLGHP